MNQYIAIALLCLSAVSAQQYIITNSFVGVTDCSGIALSSQANPANVCIPNQFASLSNYYTYDPAFPGNFTATSYTTKDCTGSSFSITYNFSTCVSGALTYTYSATLPKFNGIVTQTAATCGGTPVGGISSINLGACISVGSSGSSKFVWYGGSQCVEQRYDSSDCTGAIDGQNAVPYSCTASGNSQSIFGCQIDGVYRPASTLSPAYPSNSPVTVTKFYPLRQDCTGPVAYTAYTRLASCNGEGSATAIVNNKPTVSVYDNYNCSGVLLDTITAEGTLGQCDGDDESDTSTITTSGSFPSSVNTPVAVIQSSCTGSPTVYGAVVYSGGCIQFNSTAAATIACSTLSNNSISFVTNTYANTACTGPIIETETSIQLPCESDPDQPGIAYRYACSATFSPSSSSTSSTVAVAFSVMIMSLVAALLM